MIITVTPNPSIDRTVTLPTALVRGAVHRVTSVSSEPGGKGVNVARALTLAGLDVIAVLPAARHDPILVALSAIGVDVHAVPVRAVHLVEPSVDERESTRAGHKHAIASAAADFIPQSGATVLFDAGTTTARVAALLPPDRELLIVTNSVPIAARLASLT